MAIRDKTRTRDPKLGRYDSARPQPDEAPLDVPVAPRGVESGSWRNEVASASGLNVVAGIWLIISPFVLDYGPRDSTWNPIVFGAVVGVFALARAGGAYRASILSWANMAIGIWLFISAFWLANSARASWNVGILGIVVFILGAWSATATEAGLAQRRARL
jgi:SPW repeat-containing protein